MLSVLKVLRLRYWRQRPRLMQRSVLEMGGLTILLATTAMIWNIIYNALFDRLWPAHQVRRTAKVRALHALGFESGFIVIGVSIVALGY